MNRLERRRFCLDHQGEGNSTAHNATICRAPYKGEMLLQVERPAIDRLNELKLPTLIMLGELDLFQREEAELLARRVAGARLVVVP